MIDITHTKANQKPKPNPNLSLKLNLKLKLNLNLSQGLNYDYYVLSKLKSMKKSGFSDSVAKRLFPSLTLYQIASKRICGSEQRDPDGSSDLSSHRPQLHPRQHCRKP